jgi:predicted N-acetyltransferase YhbS
MTALRNTPVALTPNAAPFVIRAERASDVVAREALLDACFGVNRHAHLPAPARRTRARRRPRLLGVREGRLVGTVRLWHVSAGGVPALMLGPLAVDESCRKLGVGAALMNHALAAAGARPWRGDPARRRALLRPLRLFGRKTGELSLPGPFERDRLLGLELRDGALDGASGMIVATGALCRNRNSPAKKTRLVPRAA